MVRDNDEARSLTASLLNITMRNENDNCDDEDRR